MPRFADLAQVTRQDIRHFDTEAKKLVDAYHDAGWRSYLSSNSHAIFQAPDGSTTASVSGHNDKAQVRRGRAELERWLRRNGVPRGQRRQLSRSLRRRTNSFSLDNYQHKHEHQPINQQEDNPMTTETGTTYRCTDCPDRDPFPTGGALALHRQRKHGMTCPECGEEFHGGGNSKRYNAHRLERHGVEPKKKVAVKSPDGVYPCPWCTAVFGTGQALAAHSKVHEGQARHPQVPAAPQSTPAANGITNGLNEHHPARKSTPGDCTVCGDYFDSTNGLNAHMRKHKGKDEGEDEKATQAPGVAVLAAPTAAAGTDLNEWIAGQDAGDLLAQVLAIVAAPLVGQVERLRRERDELTQQVQQLARSVEEHETKMTILKEAMGL